MKILICMFSLLVSASAFACPTISGTYKCVQSDHRHVIYIDAKQDSVDGVDRYVILDGINTGGKLTFVANSQDLPIENPYFEGTQNTSCKDNTLRSELSNENVKTVIKYTSEDGKAVKYSLRKTSKNPRAVLLAIDYACTLEK